MPKFTPEILQIRAPKTITGSPYLAKDSMGVAKWVMFSADGTSEAYISVDPSSHA